MDRKFVLQMIFLFILGSFKSPSPWLPLELNGGLLLHGLTTMGQDTFFSSEKKNGLQLEGREIGYAKASVHDQITEIKLMYDRISVCGAIMGYLN